jgi:hypothetical protein
MEKFLIITFRTIIPDIGMRLITKMIKCFDAMAYIVSPVDRQVIKRMAANEGLKEEDVKKRCVHEIYMHLYELEERFKNEAIDVTISTMDIVHSEDLISGVKKIHPAVVIILGPTEISLFEAMRESLSVPILFLPMEETY